MIFAWSLTEVIRYSYYGFSQFGARPARRGPRAATTLLVWSDAPPRARVRAGTAPYVLTWPRYTFFFVLYPLGVASELALVHQVVFGKGKLVRQAKRRARAPFANVGSASITLVVAAAAATGAFWVRAVVCGEPLRAAPRRAARHPTGVHVFFGLRCGPGVWHVELHPMYAKPARPTREHGRGGGHTDRVARPNWRPPLAPRARPLCVHVLWCVRA